MLEREHDVDRTMKVTRDVRVTARSNADALRDVIHEGHLSAGSRATSTAAHADGAAPHASSRQEG